MPKTSERDQNWQDAVARDIARHDGLGTLAEEWEVEIYRSAARAAARTLEGAADLQSMAPMPELSLAYKTRAAFGRPSVTVILNLDDLDGPGAPLHNNFGPMDRAVLRAYAEAILRGLEE